MKISEASKEDTHRQPCCAALPGTATRINGGEGVKERGFPEGDRLQVLLAVLQERYNASHKIRERSMQFVLWISGLAVGLCWILINQKNLSFAQQMALSLLIGAVFIGAMIFISGLRKGFKGNRQAMINVESALGMHEPGVFLSDVPLLPSGYACIKPRCSDHFCTLIVWLTVLLLALLILTWVQPSCLENTHPKTQPMQTQ